MYCRRYRPPDDQQRVRELGSYTAGMLAAQMGRPITDCPHERKSKKKTAWLKGWDDYERTG